MHGIIGAVALLAGVQAVGHPGIEPVVAAERAFAAKVKAEGVARGFRAFAAPDGFLFQPGPTPVAEAFAGAPETVEDPPLEWWPEFAGIASSGDLGFTTGSASIPVRYFTVWRKQADGSWKYIYDGGPGLAAPMTAGGDRPVAALPASTAAAGSPQQALAEIAPIEAAIAAASDRKTAMLSRFAEEGIAAGSPQGSLPGREGQRAELDRRPAGMTLRPLGGEASAAGDLAFTYGEARWAKGDAKRWGHYARIWQKRTEGWKLAADLLIAAPGAPPA